VRFARIDMLVKEQVYFSHTKPSRHVKNGSICSKDAHNIWSVFICVHVCNYFLLAIDRKNVVRTNNTYHMLFQSIQNDNTVTINFYIRITNILARHWYFLVFILLHKMVTLPCVFLDYDPCVPNPCTHGVCTSSSGSVQCSCHSGYSGTTCGKCCWFVQHFCDRWQVTEAVHLS
jgi:hypothetical protein